MNPQSVRLLNYLRNHLHITALEAMNDLGIFRLGARIWDLKQAGIDPERLEGRQEPVRRRLPDQSILACARRTEK